MNSQRPSPLSAGLTIERLHELLSAFLPDYLRLVEPDQSVWLDLKQLELLPTEDPALVVAKAPTTLETQEIFTVIVHLAEEPLARSEAGPTIARIVAQLGLQAAEPFLLSVVYLSGGRPGVNLETAPLCRFREMDLVRAYYTALGLEGLRAEYYADHSIPLAWALAPYLTPIGDPETVRRRCRDRIVATSVLAEEHRALLLRAVDAAR